MTLNTLMNTRFEQAKTLANALMSEHGEASGAAVAGELLEAVCGLSAEDRLAFERFLTFGFQPPAEPLRIAAQSYLASATPATAARLAEAADPPRQEILRRMNMAPGGTAALIALREDISRNLRDEPALKLLDADLKHLFASWFNRGFLELRRVDWQTPAAVLEKLIAHEAVHAMEGWPDLRRRLAPDRRCFAYFHPVLPEEPLIFVEVALVEGLAGAVQPLLDQAVDAEAARQRADRADTAIFYSISNCQKGLRGVSFGNLLIKQVVEELKAELPRLTRFSTLSPIPGFRHWLDRHLAGEPDNALAQMLAADRWWLDGGKSEALRQPLLAQCAAYLTRRPTRVEPADPVARFHLGNGARLERINWLGNTDARGLQESYGVMANYLYDPATIVGNHEAFARDGTVVRSADVDALMKVNDLDNPHGYRQREPSSIPGHVTTIHS